MRLTAGLLLVSLLCAVIGAGMGARTKPASEPYAAWLRTQLRLPADASLARAIDEAAASDEAQTLEGFLDAFVEAYEAQHPRGALAVAFVTHDLSNDALIALLESRFNGIGTEAVPARASLQPVLVQATSPLDRDAVKALAGVSMVLGPVRPIWMDYAAALQGGVRLLRLLSAAQPLGP